MTTYTHAKGPKRPTKMISIVTQHSGLGRRITTHQGDHLEAMHFRDAQDEVNIFRDCARPGSYMMIEIEDDATPKNQRPGEDAGRALVGVRCWVYNAVERWAWLEMVTGYVSTSNYPYDTESGIFAHARPEYLGHPDPAKRAVKP